MKWLLPALLAWLLVAPLAGQSEPDWVLKLKQSVIDTPFNVLPKFERLDQFYQERNFPGFQDTLVDLLTRVARASERTDSSRWIAQNNYTLGTLLLANRRLEEAQEKLFRSLDHYERREDTIMIARSSASICILNIDLDNPSAALPHCERAAALEPFIGDPYNKYYALEPLPDVHLALKDYDAAIAATDRMLRVLEEAGEFPGRSLRLHHSHNRRAMAYLDQERYVEAVRAADTGLAVPVREEFGRPWYEELAATRGLALAKLGRNAEAVAALTPYVRSGQQTGDLAEMIPYLTALGTTYERLGRSDSALYYQQLAWAEERRVATDRYNTLADELSVAYQTEQQRRELARQEAYIAQQARLQRLTYGGLALLLLGLGALGYLLVSNRRQNRELARHNAENELLLKEIHHRVKNNLETVSGLLELQSATLDDERALAAMQSGRGRVQSMGLLHQRLYQGEQLATIAVEDYLHSLADSLLETYGAEERLDVRFAVEDIQLDVDTAIPLGLIVNELLTNAIKYAYPEQLGGAAGAIIVDFRRTADDRYYLCVSDAGVGKPGHPTSAGTGFGTRLVELLTRQLRGELRESTPAGGGLRTELTFGNR